MAFKHFEQIKSQELPSMGIDNVSAFLKDISVEYLGYILHDANVPKAVRQQKAFLELYPFSKFSVCINELSEKISKEKPSPLSSERDQPYFWRSAFQVQ